MIGEYKINRPTRQCHALGRPLRPGEWYFSVILESGDDYVRHDYSAEAWTEPPEGAIGWWKKRMPTDDQRKLVLAPPEVLVDLLRRMGDDPGKAKGRYLLALMLLRRRVLRPAVKLDAATPTPNAQSREAGPDENTNSSESPGDIFRVEVIADGSTIDVPTCQISRAESDTLRDELNELLYCEAADEDDEA